MKKPRFQIQPYERRTRIRKRQRFGFTVKSNHNGQPVCRSEKYHNRIDRDEIMHALRDELGEAVIKPEIHIK